MKNKLRKALEILKYKYSACALKLGTEAEDNSFEDIIRIQEIVSDELPIVLKIGGCEARNDMQQAVSIGINGIIAPMIESSYALKLFISALKTISKDSYNNIKKIINIETITGINNIKEIIDQKEFKELDQVTIGRTDLSSSLNCNVDSDTVYNRITKLTSIIHNENKIVSIGGSITPASAIRIENKVKPDKINIRTVVINLKSCKNIKEAIIRSLEFEILLLEFRKKYRKDVDILDKRMNLIMDRMCVIA